MTQDEWLDLWLPKAPLISEADLDKILDLYELERAA